MSRLGACIPVGPLVAAALAAHLSGCGDDASYPVGGTVAGLVAGHEVTLLNNGSDTITVTTNGRFVFPTPIASHRRYSVTIGVQPSGQICVVAAATASGVATRDVVGISVTCDLWTQTSAPAINPVAIAMSTDASHLAVAEQGGGILTSADGGATWTRTRAPRGAWSAIGSSADGTQLAAAMNPGGIYMSTNAGITWSATSAPTASWTSIASSADGTQLVASNANNVINSATQAITFVGALYMSTDAGLIWSQSNAPCCDWAQVASSADGTRLAAASTGGSPPGTTPQVFSPNGLFASSNSGATWVLQSCAESPPVTSPASACAGVCAWNSVASSADGLTLVASRNGLLTSQPRFASITVTHDGGTTWIVAGAPSNLNWLAVASSSDGTRLAAAGSDGVYLSSDGGTSWNKTSAPSTISSVVSSADGKQLAAINNDRTIWVGVSF